MTPEQQARVDEVHEYIGSLLHLIAEIVPEHRLTLIMRHPTNPKASAVCSDDDDLNAATETLADSKALRAQAMN